VRSSRRSGSREAPLPVFTRRLPRPPLSRHAKPSLPPRRPFPSPSNSRTPAFLSSPTREDSPSPPPSGVLCPLLSFRARSGVDPSDRTFFFYGVSLFSSRLLLSHLFKGLHPDLRVATPPHAHLVTRRSTDLPCAEDFPPSPSRRTFPLLHDPSSFETAQKAPQALQFARATLSLLREKTRGLFVLLL